MDKKIKILIVIAIIIIIALIIGIGYSVSNKKEEVVEKEEIVFEPEPEPEPEKQVQIFSGDDRPIAFMIDNNVNAQPQSALNQAYLVYEIIVEGGETRLMALFKGVDTSVEDVNIGPIRSARHYFVDYALENNAIYTHLGQSPQAQNYIENYDVDDINGQTYDTGKAQTQTSLFWRERAKKSPHNAYTSIESIKQICQKNDYKITSNQKSLLNYAVDDVILPEKAIPASAIAIPYTTSHEVQYIYDEATGRYTRYSKGTKQVDELTGEDITTKNIIISFVRNYDLNDGENKGRQELSNQTNSTGYYITNGKAIKILCKKQAVGKATVYVDELGNEINVNDGNTWINICPIDAEVTLE